MPGTSGLQQPALWAKQSAKRGNSASLGAHLLNRRDPGDFVLLHPAGVNPVGASFRTPLYSGNCRTIYVAPGTDQVPYGSVRHWCAGSSKRNLIS